MDIKFMPLSAYSLPLTVTGAGNGIRTRDPQLGRLTLYH